MLGWPKSKARLPLLGPIQSIALVGFPLDNTPHAMANCCSVPQIFMRRTLTCASVLLLAVSPLQAAETTPSSAKPSSRSTESGSKPRRATKEKAAPVEKTPSSEDERFAAARKAASEDPKVAELRAKADAAKSDETANKAMRAYLRTMYGKMRTLEPSLEERINMTEAAALRAVPQ